MITRQVEAESSMDQRSQSNSQKQKMRLHEGSRVKIIGQCPLTAVQILERLGENGPSSLLDLGGQYVVVIEDKQECHLITSPYGLCQYYYTVHNGKLFHGDTLLDVLRASGLCWSWNLRALTDLAQLDYVLEDETLHTKIHRTPAASVLHFQNGEMNVTSLSWEQLHPRSPANADLALTAFNEAVAGSMHEDSVVSMSGGFESRVILSSLLAQGCTPGLLTMGYSDSTDVFIARQIASELDLDLTIVELVPEDYLKWGQRIVELTSGTKTAWNWHTYLYSRQAPSGRTFFVGTNGGFAKSGSYWGLDKGICSQLANTISGPLALQCFWVLASTLKLRRVFKKEELGGLHPGLARQFEDYEQRARVRRMIGLCHNEFLDGIDRFFLEQRVRNFHGHGLKLYCENVAPLTPFLDREWCRIVWNLKRSWKLGTNWHRFAIQQNWPGLLEFPIAGTAVPLAPKAPPLYWLRSGRQAVTPYARYAEWFQRDPLSGFIRENVALLADLIEPGLVFSIADEHQKYQSRTRTLSFLLTMIFWCMALDELQSQKRTNN